jgi:hypothetical protein
MGYGSVTDRESNVGRGLRHVATGALAVCAGVLTLALVVAVSAGAVWLMSVAL